MQADPGLLEMQRRFLSALREPIFGDSRARSQLPSRDGNLSRTFTATAIALIAPSATLAPTHRLELYHRQYWYRLLDSLAEDFPALCALLERDAYWRLLEAYLEAAPSRDFTLRHLGERLAEFIHAHPELTDLSVHAEELARLEYAVCVAFEAEDHPPVDAHQIGTSPLALQPHVQLFALRTTVDSLWRGLRRGRRCRERRAEEVPRTFAVVFRRAFRLHIERLPRLAFAILNGIAATGSLERAMASVAATPGLFRRSDADRVQRWFSTWVERGWFCSARDQSTERRTP